MAATSRKWFPNLHRVLYDDVLYRWIIRANFVGIIAAMSAIMWVSYLCIFEGKALWHL